jgi:hypothetical protein
VTVSRPRTMRPSTLTRTAVDRYYAYGETHAKMDHFQPTGRGFTRPPVWLATGREGLGQWDVYATTTLECERPVALRLLRGKEKDKR